MIQRDESADNVPNWKSYFCPSTAKHPVFQQLIVADPTAPVAVIEVVLPYGQVLRIRPGFDADLLRQLLRVLEEPAC